MAEDLTMQAALRLGSSVDALAALAAHARIQGEGLDVPDDVRVLLDAVVAEMLGDDAVAGGPALVGMARTLFRLGSDLVEHPDRAGQWDHVDPVLLQGIGRMSGSISSAIVVAADQLDGLDRLRASDAAFLDVGTGSGWLAIAVARAFSQLRVTGIDLFETPLDLARGNVTAEGLADRVELRLVDVLAFDAESAYDAVWLPIPFLPKEIVPGVLSAAFRLVRPGGWVLPGTFAGPPDRLSELLVDLRTVRSGGEPWRDTDLLTLVRGAGFVDERRLDRTWAAPVHLFVGRRPL